MRETCLGRQEVWREWSDKRILVSIACCSRSCSAATDLYLPPVIDALQPLSEHYGLVSLIVFGFRFRCRDRLERIGKVASDVRIPVPAPEWRAHCSQLLLRRRNPAGIRVA
jgi:hypothetical protein